MSIKFTQEELNEGNLAFLDCLVTIQSDGTPETSVYRKDSHHPLIHKLGVIHVRTLFHRAEIVPSSDNAKQQEKDHLKGALSLRCYRDWTFHKALQTNTAEKDSNFDNSHRNSDTKVFLLHPFKQCSILYTTFPQTILCLYITWVIVRSSPLECELCP